MHQGDMYEYRRIYSIRVIFMFIVKFVHACVLYCSAKDFSLRYINVYECSVLVCLLRINADQGPPDPPPT